MDKYSLSHLSDQELLRDLDARVARVLTETAGLEEENPLVVPRRLHGANLPCSSPSNRYRWLRGTGTRRFTYSKRVDAWRELCAVI